MSALRAVQRRPTQRAHTWTAEERELVRVQFNGRREVTARLAQQIDVTLDAVRAQANKLGVMGRRGKHRLWTPKEIAWLEEEVAHLSIHSLARKLNRGTNAVSIQLGRMGLSTRYRDGWYTQEEVCSILGVGRLTLQAWRQRGELKATRHNREDGSRYSNPWRIEEPALKAFIRGHSMELSGRNVDLSAIIAMFDAPRKLPGLRE